MRNVVAVLAPLNPAAVPRSAKATVVSVHKMAVTAWARVDSARRCKVPGADTWQVRLLLVPARPGAVIYFNHLALMPEIR